MASQYPPLPPWNKLKEIKIPELVLPEKITWPKIVWSAFLCVMLISLEIMFGYIICGSFYLFFFSGSGRPGPGLGERAGVVWFLFAFVFSFIHFGGRLLGEYVRLSRMINRKIKGI